jgi:hypothetical protein
VNVIGLPFLATVFNQNAQFNRDLNRWDVSKVTKIIGSKSKYVFWRITCVVVNELCLLFLPIRFATSCFVLRTFFRMRFRKETFMLILDRCEICL